MWRGVLLLVSGQFAAAVVGKRWISITPRVRGKGARRGVVIYSWERAVEPAGLI